MASPQTENGFIKIANELYDQLFGLPLTGADYKILALVMRKTYGFNKKNDKIPLSQFQKYTNLSRKTVCNSINRLVKSRLLLVTKVTLSITEYSIQKDYEKWVVSPRLLVTNITKGSVMAVTKVVTNITHSKDNTKDNNQKTYKNFEFVNNNLDKFQQKYPTIDVAHEWKRCQASVAERGIKTKDWSATLNKWLLSPYPKKEKSGPRNT